jgi:hypothetical protein
MRKEKKPMAKEAKPVRYQVHAPVFVNGALVDPKGRNDVYVVAEPGLEGRALKLAPEEKPSEAQQSSGQGAGNGGADGSQTPGRSSGKGGADGGSGKGSGGDGSASH